MIAHPSRSPARHLVVLVPKYLDLILEGRKTIECRLSRTRRAPFGKVAEGDTLLLKATGGPVTAECVAGCVESAGDLTPAGLDTLRAYHDHGVLGGPEFWRAKRDARYATLVWLRGVRERSIPLVAPQLYGAGWVVLEQSAQLARSA